MSERSYIKYPHVPLTTEYGPAVAAFTDAGHVSVGTDGAHINDDNPCLTFRGQEYLVHVHLYVSLGWDVKPGDHVSIQRRPQWTDAPRTHRDKIVAAIASAVRAYLAEHPETLREAEYASANNELLALEGERRKAAEELAQLDARIAEQSARLAAVAE